jgi:V8-like Glu-specific endopeptidase
MAKTDVVKHDLEPPLAAEVFDWSKVEPLPLPVIPRAPSEPQPSTQFGPTTTLVSATDLTKAPYRSVGKMAMKFPGNDKELGASGWVVARRAFVTAGHCVYDRGFGGWISKAIFCPRYDNGCTKFYEAAVAYTLKGWVDDKDLAYDLAACVVTEGFASTEPPLAFQTGIFPPSQFAAIGYPGKPLNRRYDFDGKRMWQSVGALISAKDGVIWAENDLTDGASGGPWCDPNGNYRVYGVMSGRKDDDPYRARSSALLDGFDNLYDAVKNF